MAMTKETREALRAAVLEKAQSLSGAAYTETLADMALDAALAFCCREDVPPEMEQAVAALLCELAAGQGGAVKSLQRGDTAVTYDVAAEGFSAARGRLAPFRRLGTLREE